MKPNFIPADFLTEITGLTVQEANDLNYHIYVDGWVRANYVDIAEENIRVRGHFPAILTSLSEVYEGIPQSGEMRPSGRHNYTFEAKLSSLYADIGLSKRKCAALLIDSPAESYKLSFPYKITAKPTNGFDNIYILESDLLSFCEDEGVFDAQEKYDSLTVKTNHSQECDDLSNSTSPENPPPLSLHLHTSPQLYDLIEANNLFWKLYDPEDPYTAPLKKHVIQWFIDKGYSKAIAEKMDTILRDGRNQPGGRPLNP
jgi:hypothetical protein